ncbi:hypothetical protein C8R43DRAFT_885444 [Mycena crocata]|nr:hypothetical protein C8R43DRAFT_885444 [Mycena crocata]
MQFPTPQGLSSATFKQPPLDGSLLLPEIFDHHAQQSPNHPLFTYTEPDGVVQAISWSRAVGAIHRAACITREHVNMDDPEIRPVIGIVASTDQITYFSVVAGILRAGYQAFPISPRNSDAIVAHLIRSANCSHVFVSADIAMQRLAGAAASRIQELGGSVTIMPLPKFEEIFALSTVPELLPHMPKLSLDAPAVILHSSGSTAFPKIITFTYRILMESGLIPYYGQIDICGHVLSTHAVPVFHLMGVIQLPWTAFSGLTISVFPPTSPPIVPTPDRVFDGAVATNSTLMFCVPAFLESWAREPNRVAALKNFRTVIFAGGPLQPAVGDMLVQNGVKIAHVYGLTETSNVTLFLPNSPPKEGWDYFYFSPHTDPVFVPVEDMSGVYHLVIKKSNIHTPAMFNTTVDGVAALNTNDLFLRHPTNPNLWKVFGRLDDQIMHSTGEKTNPGPLEAILLKDSQIKYAVMFGRSEFHAGVIIFPDQPFDPSDTQRVVEFRRKIWPMVEQANRFAPTHSRIFKEMILIADPSKPIELTPKGTPRRQVMLDLYQSEIRNIYAAVEESSQTHLTAPQEYNAASSLEFIRRIVADVMTENPGDDEDIFQHGCDSLQATWIRNSILHALRNSKQVDIRLVPNNFVYSRPTLRLLAEMFTDLVSGAPSQPSDISRRADAMQEMVHKHTEGFSQHRATGEHPKTEVILVTGTTGALGSQIIAQLLALPEISTVYALNRRGKSIQDRQRTSFSTNGIDVQLLESPKLKLLEGNLNESAFGLVEEDFRAIKDNVTTIIHNAWQVNFNMSLPSMEPLVAGSRKLVDLALASPHPVPPRLIFVSTAGIFRSAQFRVNVALEEHLSDPRISVGMGYTESKWVTEGILAIAAQKTVLSPIIIRPGQLSGAENGAWNPTDWFPTLLASSKSLGHLPALCGHASWVPIHHAAGAIVEMRNSEDRYFHITHPHPTPMADIMLSLSKALDLPLVPYPAWLKSLEETALQESSASTNPALRLIDFFRSYQEVSPDQEAFVPATLMNVRAIKAANSLRSLTPLAQEDTEKWVSYLHSRGSFAQ